MIDDWSTISPWWLTRAMAGATRQRNQRLAYLARVCAADGEPHARVRARLRERQDRLAAAIEFEAMFGHTRHEEHP